MKEFNLEEAKNGAELYTKERHKARIIAYDRAGEYPIVALITNKNGVEIPEIYDENGKCATIKGTERLD